MAAMEVLEGIKVMLDFKSDYINNKAKDGMIDLKYVHKLEAGQEVRNSFNRVRIWAQKYQITPVHAEQDRIAQQWLAELEHCRKQVRNMPGAFLPLPKPWKP